MYYHFKVHKEAKGYWAECLELKGCQTQGSNLEELQINMEEALNLYLSEPEDSKYLFPMPSKNLVITKKNLIYRVKVDSQVAFAMLLRQTRLKHNYTLKEMATILEYKNINSYVKLEKAKSSNPELKTLSKIKKHFSKFPFFMIF